MKVLAHLHAVPLRPGLGISPERRPAKPTAPRIGPLLRSLLIPALMAGLAACTQGLDDDEMPKASRAEGAQYVFGGESLAELHLSFTEDDWNSLLKRYDKNENTKYTIPCSVVYIKDGETSRLDSVGFRLRGRSSRQRPEGRRGQTHQAADTDWHHFHFGLNFNKYIDGSRHSLHGQRKLWAKWPHEDPSYMREHYSFDLFQRYGVWTAPSVAFCRVYLKVQGDGREAYLGVFNLIEPLDGNFVKKNEDRFGGADGFLWKCSLGAQLNNQSGQTYGYEKENSEKDYTYELKTQTEQYEAAKAQLKGFISQINSLKGEAFDQWMAAHCDVEQLLRMYAVNVILGMWDDYWGNANNFFLYFNSQDPDNYKVYMLPYDYDNSLGTTFPYYVEDPGTHSPLDWGPSSRPFIYKILQNAEWKQFYVSCLKELADPGKDLFHWDHSRDRLTQWRNQIETWVSNDTGEDMKIQDKPASWSGIKTYRIYTAGKHNFFQVRTAVIEDM